MIPPSQTIGGIMLRNIFLTLAVFISAQAMAHEHSPQTMRGTGIELQELDHAMAGSVLGHPIYAGFSERNFSARLTMAVHGNDLQMQITDQNGQYRGQIEMLGEDGTTVERVTAIEFVRIERQPMPEQIRIHLLLNQNPIQVDVVGERFQDGHFIAPTFRFHGIASDVVEMKFTGESCFAYSANIAMLVATAYAHLNGI